MATAKIIRCRFFRISPEPSGHKYQNLYSSTCPVCGRLSVPSLADNSSFEAIIANVAAQLYNGKLPDGTIPRELYEQTANTLMSGMFEGLGGKKTFAYDDPNNTLAAYLRQNIHAFSAAKSTVQMQAFNDLLLGPDGKPRSEADFIAQVAKTGATFNKNHLATERNSTIAKAQMAQVWHNFADDEYIQISTAGDANVRPHHATLHGFTALKTSRVWLRLWPPFDWECRCHATPGLAKNARDAKASDLLTEAKVPAYFQNNSGITKTIFDNEHPYFQDSFGKTKKYGPKNFNMPTVEKIYTDNDFQPAVKADSESAALAWWEKKTGKNVNHFDVKDAIGTTLRFDKTFLQHVLNDNTDDRYKILVNIEDVVTKPDEVWCQRNGDRLETAYIKYYDDYPICVMANEARPYTMFSYFKNGKLNESSLAGDRQGTLLFRL